jgi:hypothetical protein
MVNISASSNLRKGENPILDAKLALALLSKAPKDDKKG